MSRWFAAPAACATTRGTSAGCEMKATWLALIAVVLSPIRLAENRSSSGSMARQPVPTISLDGDADGVARAVRARLRKRVHGRGLAEIRLVSAGRPHRRGAIHTR
jgi:hypothetical protein